MKSAILVLDMLNDFFKDPLLKNKRSKLSANINDLIGFARRKYIPVIWVRQEFKPNLSDAYLFMKKRKEKVTIKGTLGARILEELNKEENDFTIIKKRWSAFFKTKLESLLKKMKIDTLILTGIYTHACVRMTAIDAYQRDYEVILAKNCIDSWDKEHRKITLDYLTKGLGIQLLTIQQIKEIMKKDH